MRKLIIMLFTVILVVLLSACGDSNGEINDNDVNNEKVEPSDNDSNNNMNANNEDDAANNNTNDNANGDDEEKGLNDVVEYFEDEGYDIGNKEVKASDMIGADSGFGIDVDGEQIELYIYDDESVDLQEIKDNGAYDMDGFSFPAINNGNTVLIGHDDHPNKEEIIETFKSY